MSVEYAKLLAKAKQSAKLVLIEGMNHTLKGASTDRKEQVKTYSDPSLPLDPQVISETSTFVQRIKKQGVRH